MFLTTLNCCGKATQRTAKDTVRLQGDETMAVPKGKVSKSRKNMRRAHDAVDAPGISVCPQCNEPKMPHRVCSNCGYYKGKEIISGDE